MKEAKIILFDIETAPNLGWFWEMWETNPIGIKTNWHLLSFSWKYLGDERVHTHSLPDYPEYKKDKDDDSALARHLWEILDYADIVIAHNGDKFDVKKANARFIFHKLKPPTPYKTIDTLKVARKHFKFDSNKLDSLGKYLGVGEKLPHTGAHLWFGCMSGDKESWKLMKKYNEQDVMLLEKVYLQLRPWMTTHPNVNIYDEFQDSCPTCGAKVEKRGFGYAQLSSYQRYCCKNPKCGAWSRGSSIKSDLYIR